MFGHLIDGVQAEYARVPFADTSTYRVRPEGLTDEQVLYLADILPTGYEVGVLNGRIQPGDTVVIVGDGADRSRHHPRCAAVLARADHRGRHGRYTRR